MPTSMVIFFIGIFVNIMIIKTDSDSPNSIRIILHIPNMQIVDTAEKIVLISNPCNYFFLRREHLQCVSKKVYAIQKSPHINISKYFQELFIHVGSYTSLLSNDTKKSDDIVCLSKQEPHL